MVIRNQFKLCIHAFGISKLLFLTAVSLAGCSSESSEKVVSPDAEESIDFSTYPAISLPTYAYTLSDTDGGRTALITATQIDSWVADTNTKLTKANINLTFDSSNNFGAINNSTINNSDLASSNNLPSNVISTGDAYAANNPTYVTMFFRYGPNSTPVGSGYSGTGIDFIALPSFDYTTLCGSQNIEIMAHEVGHYLGLPHTFAHQYATYSDLGSYFTFTSSNPDDFDGDGILDTGPDPYVNNYATRCANSGTLTINDTKFNIPYGNTMSYYGTITTGFTTQQAKIMRQVALVRFGTSLTSLVPGTTKEVFEGESMTVSSGINYTARNTNENQWSNGQDLYWQPSNIGEELSLAFTVATAGTYTVYLGLTYDSYFGQFRYKLNGVETSSSYDSYRTRTSISGGKSIGSFELIAGTNTLTITLAGQNSKSSGVVHGLDYIIIAQ